MVFTPTLRRAAAQSAGAFRAPRFSPQYRVPFQLYSLSPQQLFHYGRLAGAFGASAGVFALFFFGEIPRVRNDILRQLPFFDEYYDRNLAPEDNPF